MFNDSGGWGLPGRLWRAVRRTERAALAVQSFRSRDDRAAATALQQSLLLSDLPAVPGTARAREVPGPGWQLASDR